jgi:hypothetical protein
VHRFTAPSLGERKRKLWLVTAAAACAAALAGLPLVAAAAGNGERTRISPRAFVIGFHLKVAPPGQNPLEATASGDFTAAGAIVDSGEATARVAFTPLDGLDGPARTTGTVEFKGRRGSITTRFRGMVNTLAAPTALDTGSIRIIAGTGAYAHLRGRGTFQGVGDFTRTPPTFTVTHVGRVTGRGDDEAEVDEE